MEAASEPPLRLRLAAGFLILSLAFPPAAWANPQGAAVRQGQVRIHASPGQLQIRQMTQRAVIDWESFSIARGELTRFIQPNANSAVLNRVRGNSASQIEGMLRANGRVYLINPNGILIGPNGTIDVAGFVASTLDTGDRAFMRGGNLRFTGASEAAVVNLGSISALKGDVVLMGASVLNAGTIRAPRGTAALAAGNDILLAESGEERVFVRGAGGSRKAEGVTNTGNIEANIAELKSHGGNVYGMAVNNEGRVAATGVTRSGGQIFLSAGGGRVRSTGTLQAKRSSGSGGRIKVDAGRGQSRTEVGGIIDASSMTGAGGEIVVLGNEIEVIEGTLILNDGETGGGGTYLGGGRRGADRALANAENVTIGNGAVISADALGSGNGGEIVLFADGTLVIDGIASAKGGAFGGNGGFVELSGKREVFAPDLANQIRVSAPSGESGFLLLDPMNISVIHGTGGGLMGTTITDGELMSVLANFPVLLETSELGGSQDGDITFASDVNIFWSSPYNLSFVADRDAVFNPGAVINATGGGSFSMTAARSILVGSGASITTTNGNLNLSANSSGTTIGNFVGIQIDGGTVQSLGSGSATLSGRGGISGNGNDGVLVTSGGSVSGGTGGILSITGFGGISTGDTNRGVATVGGTVSSLGGNVIIQGTGGGAGTVSSENSGVFLSNGSLQAGNGGSLTIVGAGGVGDDLNHKGVWVSAATIPASISTSGGAISITGTGGGTGASSNNQGVDLAGAQVLVSAAGGPLTITGTGGAGTATAGIRVSGTVNNLGGADISFVSDGISIGTGSTTIDSGGGMTTIRPLTNGLQVDLGGSDVAGSILGLTDAELDRITAGTVQIGNGNTGPISVSGAISHGNHLSLTTGAGVTINNAITLVADRNLTVNALGTSTGTISLANSNADLSTTGTGAISLTTARNLSLAVGSSVTTVNGNLTLLANSAGTTSGDFTGVLVDGGLVQTTGTGILSVSGKGGTSSTSLQIGVRVMNGGDIIGGTGGTTTITGVGLGSGAGGYNYGVQVRDGGSSLTTNGANLVVSGTGGTGFEENHGVEVNFGALITAGGSGAVSVTGTAGSGSNYQYGVAVFNGSGITSGGGTVTVNGTGGSVSTANAFSSGVGVFGSGSTITSDGGGIQVTGNGVNGSGNHIGVWVGNGGSIFSTDSATLDILGTGGSGPNGFHFGILVEDANSKIGTVDGNLSLNGTGGSGGNFNHGIRVQAGGEVSSSGMGNISLVGTAGPAATAFGVTISNAFSGGASVRSTGTGNVTVTTDSFEITGTESIDAGANTVSIRQRTNGHTIHVGGSDSATNLGLTDAELDRITAGLVEIGNSNTGPIIVNGSISHGNELSLVSGAGVTLNQSILMAPNRSVSINTVDPADGFISFTGANSRIDASGTGTVTLVAARNLSLSAGSGIGTQSGNVVLSANAGGTAAGTFNGISLTGASIETVNGSIFLTGEGGDDAGSGNHVGVQIAGGSIVASSGSGSLQIQGTGGLGTNNNHGVFIRNSGTEVRTVSGALSITGTGASGGTGNNNDGIIIDGGALVASNSGHITLGGTAGGGVSGRNGITILNLGTLVRSESGRVDLTGTGGSTDDLSNFGISLLDNASVQTGAGDQRVRFAGNGGTGGINLALGASITTEGGNIDLFGTAGAGNHPGITIGDAQISANGGVLHLKGDGSGTGRAVDSTSTAAMIGGTADRFILESLGGSVNILGQVSADNLQLRDSTGLNSVAFTLDNSLNDVGRFSAIDVESVYFRDADGFTVSDYFEVGGVSATGDITLISLGGGDEPVVLEHGVSSQGGTISIEGRHIVVDASNVTNSGDGSISLTASRAILIRDDSQLQVEDGDLNLTAHSSGTAPGIFTGITILGSGVRTTGEGNLVLSGRGGSGGIGVDFSFPDFINPGSNGIRVDGGSVISSSSTAANAGGIYLTGIGGAGPSDSNGLLLVNTDTIVQTQSSPIQLTGTGGGSTGGTANRGIHVIGATVRTGGNGALSLTGTGGAGVSMIDGIELHDEAELRVADGPMILSGSAGGTLGIGVNATASSGDLRVGGLGSISITGEGVGADGIHLGNTSALLGGASATSLDLTSDSGDLVVDRMVQASGNIGFSAPGDAVRLSGPVTSTGGNLDVAGFDLTLDGALTAGNGGISLVFGEQGIVTLPGNGTAAVNSLFTSLNGITYLGGTGTGDTLTFANNFSTSSGIGLDFADLASIENVIGTTSSSDHLFGPAGASNYNFTGPDEFSVGGVNFFSFENLNAGNDDDTFAFSGNAFLSGTLDGGGGTNLLDYGGYGTGVIVDLAGNGGTGIGGGFSNIATFSGSGNIDTVTGPGTPSIYNLTAPDSVQVGSATVTGFENLIGGPGDDRFIFHPGASVSGYLDGGASRGTANDILDYSLFGSNVSIDLGTLPFRSATGIDGGFIRINDFVGSGLDGDSFTGPNLPTNYLLTAPDAFNTVTFRATGFENLNGGRGQDTFLLAPGAGLTGRLSGAAGADTLSFATFGRPVTVSIGPNTATGLGGGFAEIETIVGSNGSDRFLFLDQQTIPLVDGGGGTDLIEINDSTLSGNHTYTVTSNSISRNPVYNFRNFEAVRLFLGRGDNTVNSDFFDFTQFIHGGEGFNTLNLPGVTTLDGANPIGNVHHFNFDAPRPGTTVDTGGLLQLEVDQSGSNTEVKTQQNFQTENRFSIVDPATMNLQIGALTGGFSAAIVAQAIVVNVDGNTYFVLRPFSLDGSGLTPSNLAVGALNESLGVEANLELAAAIGYEGAIFLFNPDGPYAIDLSSPPADPALLTLLNESLSIAAAAELSAALGLNLVVAITGTDGIVPAALDGSAPGPAVTLLLSEQLGDPAFAELNAAVPDGN